MEGTRLNTISLENFIKRSWPMLVLGAVLIVGASIALFVFAVSGKGRASTESQAVASTSTEQAVTSTTDLVSRSIDGVLVPIEQANLQPFAVMVENYIDARPLSGPAKANLVYEFPVEGGITRFMLVFDASSTVDQIGPVRSAREYYVEMADGMNAVYAHVGGSPEALATIKGMPAFRNLDQFFNEKYFWRTAKRVAPHNVYTRTDLLNEAASTKGWKAGTFHGWMYKDDAPLVTTSTSVARGSDDGPAVSYGGSYDVSWTYDRDSNLYVRSQAGARQKDADGTPVQVKNVVVISTDGAPYDSYGRLHIRTTGKGTAELYRDGQKLAITWQRTAGGNIQFQSVDGSDVLFDRGPTWVEVVIDSAMYQAAVGGGSYQGPAPSGSSSSTAAAQ
jgi:hypothetical protein